MVKAFTPENNLPMSNKSEHPAFKKVESFAKTQGFSKILNSLEDIVKTEKFQERILNLRQKYGITPTEETALDVPFLSTHNVNFIELNKGKGNKRIDTSNSTIELTKDLESLCTDFGFTKSFLHIFETYLFRNQLDIRGFNYQEYGMCIATDENGKDVKQDVKEVFPVSIRIRAEASKRDILNYIEKMYTHDIEPIQKKYRNKNGFIGKSKKKNSNVQKRNDFVWQNRHLPLLKIQELVTKEFGTGFVLDTGYISKIINTERKRRKEV